MVKGTANDTVGLGYDPRAGQIGRCVANGSPPLQRSFRAALPLSQAAEMGSATRYTLRCIPGI